MSSTNNFRLISSLLNVDKEDEALKSYYKNWRAHNQNSKSPFIALDNSFKDKYLKDIEAGPLKLYLFFSFAANNEHGHSWHSIQGIAEFFSTQTRTVDNWIKVLVDKGLIYRAQKDRKTHTTYLLPYSDTIIKHPSSKKYDEDNQDLLEDLIKKIKDIDFVYGEIVAIHHLFQWVSEKGKPVNDGGNYQVLMIITKRKNGVLIGHRYILRNSKNLCVNMLDIDEPLVFKSPFQFNDSNIVGIALPLTPSIKNKTAIKDTLSLIHELSVIENWQLEDRQELHYGKKDDILPVINDEDNDKEGST